MFILWLIKDYASYLGLFLIENILIGPPLKKISQPMFVFLPLVFSSQKFDQ